MSIFSERVSYLLKRDGLTQAQFASDLDMTPQKASLLIKGREPRYDLLVKIAKYFHVTVDFLLGASDNEQVSVATFSDVAKVFLSLIGEGAVSLQVENISEGMDQAHFGICEYETNQFFVDYARMADLLTEGKITAPLFYRWVQGELNKLKACDLPVHISWDDLQSLADPSHTNQSSL